MLAVEAALRRAVADLNTAGARWALIGGLAVSLRLEPRSTKDVDFVVAVADDAEAESLVAAMIGKGYIPLALAEQDYVRRLATARLGSGMPDVLVDLLFASSGIENEIVSAAEPLEVLPGVTVPVATCGHLIALKILAGRPHDLDDLSGLAGTASDGDLAMAREAVRLISARGFSRGKDLAGELEAAIRAAREH